MTNSLIEKLEAAKWEDDYCGECPGRNSTIDDCIAITRQHETGRLRAADQTIPAEQQGVFRKFSVKRVDGSDQPGGKHHGCEYFVLDTDHDPHAKAALSAYAMSCVKTHPELSKDMFKRYELHPLDIEALEQQYYKRGWKEAQEHYTKRESRVGIPSEEICDRARGFIMGLDLNCRKWGEMKAHLESGGYNSIPRIDTQAEINPKGHITKWDVAECIYVLMNTDIEVGD